MINACRSHFLQSVIIHYSTALELCPSRTHVNLLQLVPVYVHAAKVEREEDAVHVELVLGQVLEDGQDHLAGS